ncbi:hypothetical protein HK096_004484 [Nowakowskiella sp. JEL0078]|nr:hypothetical protein HK096_004484 [Nowakowskiella sp. JEL0078]
MFFKSTLCWFVFIATISTNGQTFDNPVIWEDFADLDVTRVDSTYYYSASNMHYSPGAPILRSNDLVNWEMIGHSLSTLDFAANSNPSAYNLIGGRKYVKGVFASTMKYRKSTKTWYWIGCIEYSKTYIYTASSATGPWTKASTLNSCYYDVGLLIDDDDKMYVAYGNTNIYVAELTSDGLKESRSQQVYTSSLTIEGSRFYKRNGSYYILVTHPASEEYVLKSTSGPFGSYTIKSLALGLKTPVSGTGNPHQGGLIDTPNGNWYYMAFVDAYPGGRIPVLAPVTWTSDGWPTLTLVNGGFGSSYNYPVTKHSFKSLTGVDTFTSLSPEWEWNHNPDNSKWSLNGGLVLQTATVTNDLYNARNTITHRILGPTSSAFIYLDYTNMKDGDKAGLVLLRDSSAWIGVIKEGSTTYLVMINSITMDSSWNTASTGSEVSRLTISEGRIWLRATANISPQSDSGVQFYYSINGINFISFGTKFTMVNTWQFFMGYRFGIFNYATKSLGGSVTVKSFELSTNSSPTSISPSVSTQTTAFTSKISATIPTTSSSPTSSANSGNCASQYAQCGGSGYAGPTCCVSPYKCNYSNSYYSQCY